MCIAKERNAVLENEWPEPPPKLSDIIELLLDYTSRKPGVSKSSKYANLTVDIYEFHGEETLEF